MSEKAFQVEASHLSEMFTQHNIDDGKSLSILEALGGISGLCESLRTHLKHGIPTDRSSLQSRECFFGNNHPHLKDRTSIWAIIWEAFQDTVIQILIAAAIVSLIIGSVQDPEQGWMEGVAILLAVTIVISVTATNDYMKEGQFIKLNKQTSIHKVVVIRDSRETEIPAHELLVGDLMSVNPGEVMPVDGVLVRGSGLSIDESAITGESAANKKNIVRAGDISCNPFLVSGGRVNEGTGFMVVCAVGANSVMERHRILSEFIEEEEETPLQQVLGDIAAWLGKLGFVAGALLIVVLMVHLAVNSIVDQVWGEDEWEEVISSFILGITILVVAIPEGLPLALTLAMAYSVMRMKKENIFVRHLRGCEVMGAATNILSDKTGTLTQNRMKITKAFLFGQEFERAEDAALPPEKKKLLAEILARNSTAALNRLDGSAQIVGNRTEGAMLELIERWGLSYQSFRDPDLQRCQYAFNSMTKRMTTVYEDLQRGGVVYCKGAAEVVLPFCERYLSSEGEAEITREAYEVLEGALNRLSAERLRVLAVAYRPSSLQALGELTQEALESRMVFVGFVGIEDPIRPEVRSAVLKVQEAGVIVRMVTGDNMETAISIAKQSNILPANMDPDEVMECVMDGKFFRDTVGGLVTITEDSKITGFRVGDIAAFQGIYKKLRVISRCSPEDKLLFVIGLKEMGEVVAVTGDGSNDAAALKQSDIGLAMMSGTQLAKESSDIILLDDNFESVVNSVKWGRNVYASIRKFLQFQMTVNVVALAVCILGGVSVEDSPLSAVQMLWVNLIMDSLAALALATEPPTDDLFKGKPFGRQESMISYDMYVTIISQSIYQICVLLLLLFLSPSVFDIEEGWDNDDWDNDNGIHFTLFFHSFVMLQLFNEFNCRKLELSEVNVFKGIFSNVMFIGIIITTVIVQFFLVEVGGEPIRCAPLELYMHVICISIGLSGLLFGLLIRFSFTLYRNSKKNSLPKDSENESPEHAHLLDS